jgi:hypothetical protein
MRFLRTGEAAGGTGDGVILQLVFTSVDILSCLVLSFHSIISRYRLLSYPSTSEHTTKDGVRNERCHPTHPTHPILSHHPAHPLSPPHPAPTHLIPSPLSHPQNPA